MRTYTITNLNTDDQVTADDWRLEYFGLEITTTAAELPAA